MSKSTDRFGLWVILSVSLCLSACSTFNRSQVIEKKTSSELSGEVSSVEESRQNSSIASERNVVSSVEFDPQRTGLSPGATAQLNQMVEEARRTGSVTEVNIYAGASENLSAELTEQRTQNIKKYLGRLLPNADLRIVMADPQKERWIDFLSRQPPEVRDRMAKSNGMSRVRGPAQQAKSSEFLIFMKVQ